MWTSGLANTSAASATWETACTKVSEVLIHMLGPSGRRNISQSKNRPFLDFALDLATGWVDVEDLYHDTNLANTCSLSLTLSAGTT